MISYIIKECSNEIAPGFCFYGDSIFAILLILMLIFIVWNLYKVGVEKYE